MAYTVAFLGPAGTFTEAALWEFGLGDITAVPVDSPAAALALVRAGTADRAVVAIESSVDGAVTATSDALVGTPRVQIYGEVALDINFAIMGRRGAVDPAGAVVIATHPVAYQQVRQWLTAHYPQHTFLAASSNAAAAQLVAEGKADLAAAPEGAADIYDLTVQHRQVADVPGATTRFLLVGPTGAPTQRTGQDRTAVVFTLPNEPGTLVSALQEFAQRGVDLARIESRPTREVLGTYRFYVDIVGHVDDAPVSAALQALQLRAQELVFLGSWPVA